MSYLVSEENLLKKHAQLIDFCAAAVKNFKWVSLLRHMHSNENDKS